MRIRRLLPVLISIASATVFAGEADDLIKKGKEEPGAQTERSLTQAIQDFRAAIAKDPNSVAAYVEAADAQRMLASNYWRDERMNIFGFLATRPVPDESARTKLFQEALGWANSASALNSQSADALAVAALIHQNLGHSADAVKLAKSAIQMDTNNYRAIEASLMMLPNDIKTAQDLNRRALEQLKKMLAANPQDPETHYLLAAHYSNLGETAQAHAEAAAALKLNPGFTNARLVMSNTFPWYFTYTPWKRFLLLADGIKTAVDDPIVMKHQAFAAAVGILLMITLGSAYFGFMRKLMMLASIFWSIPLYLITEYFTVHRFAGLLGTVKEWSWLLTLWFVVLFLIRNSRGRNLSPYSFTFLVTEPLIAPVTQIFGYSQFSWFLVMGELYFLVYFVGQVADRLLQFGRGPWM